MWQWHQKRPGCNRPTPVQAACGSSHISGGSRFMPFAWQQQRDFGLSGQGEAWLRVRSSVGAQGTHHAAVTPEAAGVEQADASPGGVRQQPHLRRQRVHALPRVAAQHSQPQLGPAGGHHGAALPQDLHTAASGVLGFRTCRGQREALARDQVPPQELVQEVSGDCMAGLPGHQQASGAWSAAGQPAGQTAGASQRLRPPPAGSLWRVQHTGRSLTRACLCSWQQANAEMSDAAPLPSATRGGHQGQPPVAEHVDRGSKGPSTLLAVRTQSRASLQRGSLGPRPRMRSAT